MLVVAVVLSEKSCKIQVKCCVTFIVDFLLRNISRVLFSETSSCNAHEISRKSSFLISGSDRSWLLCLTVYSNDQELPAFKVLLINENLEEAKTIFTRKLCMSTRSKGNVFLRSKQRQMETACLTPVQFFYMGMNPLHCKIMLSRTGIKIQISVKSRYYLVLHKFSTAV